MIEALLAFGPPFLAVAVAAFLRWRRRRVRFDESPGLPIKAAVPQQRIQKLERECAQNELLVFEMSLGHCVPRSYSLSVRNNSDQELTVGSVTLTYRDSQLSVELSRTARPWLSQDWKVGPHCEKEIRWAPRSDPVVRLPRIETQPYGVIALPIEIKVLCWIGDKLQAKRRKQLVTVDLLSHRMKPDSGRPVSPPDRPELTARSWLLIWSQKEVDEAFNRLNTLKAQLPFDAMVEENYLAELRSIVNLLEQGSGRDVSGWLGVSPREGQGGAASSGQNTGGSSAAIRSRDRSLFRLRIEALLAFCTYQTYQMDHPQLPRRFVLPPPAAARRIH